MAVQDRTMKNRFSMLVAMVEEGDIPDRETMRKRVNDQALQHNMVPSDVRRVVRDIMEEKVKTTAERTDRLDTAIRDWLT